MAAEQHSSSFLHEPEEQNLSCNLPVPPESIAMFSQSSHVPIPTQTTHLHPSSTVAPYQSIHDVQRSSVLQGGNQQRVGDHTRPNQKSRYVEMSSVPQAIENQANALSGNLRRNVGKTGTTLLQGSSAPYVNPAIFTNSVVPEAAPIQPHVLLDPSVVTQKGIIQTLGQTEPQIPAKLSYESASAGQTYSQATNSIPNLLANVDEKVQTQKSVKLFPDYPTKEMGIPADASLEDCALFYPNHLTGEGLDKFLQRRWTAKDIWEHCKQELFTQPRNPQRKIKDEPRNVFQKRLDVRKKFLGADGIDALDSEAEFRRRSVPTTQAGRSQPKSSLKKTFKGRRKGAGCENPVTAVNPDGMSSAVEIALVMGRESGVQRATAHSPSAATNQYPASLTGIKLKANKAPKLTLPSPQVRGTQDERPKKRAAAEIDEQDDNHRAQKRSKIASPPASSIDPQLFQKKRAAAEMDEHDDSHRAQKRSKVTSPPASSSYSKLVQAIGSHAAGPYHSGKPVTGPLTTPQTGVGQQLSFDIHRAQYTTQNEVPQDNFNNNISDVAGRTTLQRTSTKQPSAKEFVRPEELDKVVASQQTVLQHDDDNNSAVATASASVNDVFQGMVQPSPVDLDDWVWNSYALERAEDNMLAGAGTVYGDLNDLPSFTDLLKQEFSIDDFDNIE